MVFGSRIGKRIVDRMPEKVFVVLIETALVVVGLACRA